MGKPGCEGGSETRYRYPVFGPTFTAPADLAGHRRRRSSRDCHHCRMTFASIALLRRHVEGVHGGAMPLQSGCYTCTVCSKSFPELRYLRQHMEKHGEERFVCEKCGQRSRWASAMVRHRRKCKSQPVNILH